MSNWGIKISKDGYDVGTCADENLVMSSEFKMLNTATSGIVGTPPGTVAHNLGYFPIFVTANNGIAGIASNSTFVESCGTTNLVCYHTYYYIFYYPL